MGNSPATVAIIIPCYNEQSYIARCLDSVLLNDCDFRLIQIVIVDGMSSDRTREIVKEYVQRHPFIQLIDNPKRLKADALNLGITSTTSDVVMRMDAHATYAPNYIRQLVKDLDRFQADNTGGVLDVFPGTTTWERAIALVIAHPFAAGNAVHRTGAVSNEPRVIDTVFNGCFRRDVFRRVGLFNPRLIRAQDRELNARITAVGGKIVLNPSIRCVYHPRTRYKNYVNWTFNGGYWVYYASRYTRVQMRSWRNSVPPVFVLWHLCLPVAASLGTVPFAVALAPVGLYWLLNLLLSAQCSLKSRSPALLFAMLVLFPTTHYVYGIGACLGLLTAKLRGSAIIDAPHYPTGIVEFPAA